MMPSTTRKISVRRAAPAAVVLAVCAIASPALAANCRCSCNLGVSYGFHEACWKPYQSIDNGRFYCYDQGWEYRADVASARSCLDVEKLALSCAGWLVRRDDWFDNDPLNPIPDQPVWITGGTLDVCMDE
jgi:hypothetical protein